MNNTQSQFLDLLSHSIRGKISAEKYENVHWDEILTWSRSHKVEGIIYSALNKCNLISKIDSEEFKNLKISTFYTGARQLTNIINLSKIFNKFNEESIPVIALKGLVIRNLYPQPEQRDMNDADILVHKGDLERVKKILIGMGYNHLEDHEASHHMVLYHFTYPMIEVHWHIVKRDGFSDNLEKFEDNLWERAIKIKVGEAEVLSLCYEDLLLHLCMHMAAHIASSGFGLRQLCDLVLLVEKKGDEISWESFIEKSKKYGFKKFNIIIFSLCNKLFDMKIPSLLVDNKLQKGKYITVLINDILNGGVYGKRDLVNNFGNQVAFNYEGKDKNATFGAMKRYMKFIFPKVDAMPKNYNYAKKFKVLTPIAWIHHLFSGALKREYSIGEKFKFIFTGSFVAIRKNKLLEWMEL